MNAAAEYLSAATGRSEIWLASDLQESNWRPDDERWAAVRASISSLQQKPSVRVLSLTGDSAPNVSLKLLGTRRSSDGLTLDLELIRSEESRGTLNLPLTAENVTIKRSKSEVIVRAQFVQPIDLKVTVYTYRYDGEQRAPVF